LLLKSITCNYFIFHGVEDHSPTVW